jgi:ABC-type ATPase with predicted acetyltransferase domain
MVGGAGPRAGARRFSLLYGDHLRISRSTNVEDIFDRFESDVRLFVGEFAPHRVFVHAGVVGWKGKAIVIPGRSYSGKSTLVAALVRAGATYYSDEYAVFDSKGLVHPFAKPLEIREEGEFTQARVTVGELGGKSGTKPLPVGIVLMTGYKRGATWRPRKLSPGKGVLEMLFNTVSARRSPEKAMSTLRQVTKAAEVLKGTRGDTANVVAALLRRMDRITDRG